MNKVKWIIFSVVTVGILVTLVIFSGNPKIDISKIDANAVQQASKQNGNIADHVFGKVGSKVTLIEYGDYQCPGCGSINPLIEDITNKYKDQLQFIFRNYPLTTIHPNAKAAAASVESAGLQGKYWEMHTKVYATQSDWENLAGNDRTNFFVKAATDLGLDGTKFKNDMASTSVDDKISFDQAIGFKINIDSTPSFYLNGKKLDSTIWSDSLKLKDAINTELIKAGIVPPKSDI